MAKLSTTSVFGDLLVDGMIHGNVTGNLTGNASTATSATTATSAGKWTTARTITIGSKGKSVDGSGNVSWTLAEIGAAASSHNHGLLHDNLTCTLENTATDNGWSMINSSYSGFLLKSIRTNSSAPSWICNNYAAGIAFGGADTKGVISTAYSSPSIKFAGGNGTKPVWWIGLTGTTGTSYNLANFENKNHGTHVTYSTSAPLVAGTASAGSAANVARGDHVHPAQTSVSGNAGTATKLATAREIKIGNTGKNFDGSANVSWTLSEIGAAASSHGHTNINKTMITTSIYNASTGILVDFNLNEKSGAMVILKLYGNSYSANPPIEAIYQFYDYSGGNLGNNPSGAAISGPAITLKVYRVGGKLKAWFQQPNTYCTFKLEVAYGNNTSTPNIILSNAAEPTDATETITITPNRVYSAAYKPTPADIGAAASSHGTHVTYATAVPKVAGTAAVGSVNRVAREDHVHPLQTSVSGNAGTATKLATARTIQIGNKSNSFDGSANITYTLADIGAAATSHTHNQINSRGNVTCESGVTGRPAVSGLSMSHAYNNGYPTPYGNVISLKGSGDGQILVGWSGTDGAHAPVYVRSKRDNTSTANWSDWAQFYTTANKPTYSDVGAAAASHGTHVTYATATPKAHGTAAVGTSSKVAREDHVHPLQASAATWTTARTLTIGNTGKSVNGSANVSWSLDEIGAASGQYKSATTAATAQWYRIAQSSASINNCLGQFEIRAAVSGKHSVTLLTAGTSYGVANGTFVQQLSHTQYSATGISKARIVYHTTYSSNYAYLEVYIPTATATEISVNLTEGFGWTLVAPNTVGSIPSGYSNKEITLVQAKIVSNVKGSLDGNASSATKLATARTLTIGSTGKTFDGSANVSWTIAEIGAAASSHSHNSITYQDTRAVNTTAKDVPSGLSVHLKSNGTDGISDGGSYHPVLMMKPWNDKSGWPVGQLAVTQNNNLYFRVSSGADDTSWNAWKKVSLDGHTHSAGGTVTAVNSNLSSVTINSYDSILSGINTNIGNL